MILKSDPCLILGCIRGDIPVYVGAAGAVASSAALILGCANHVELDSL